MDQIFKIFKIDETQARAINQSIIVPHNHTFEELIIGIAGGVNHFIDYKNDVLTAPFISFVTQGKTHKLVPFLVANACQIWVIRFKSEFIPEQSYKLYSTYHEDANLAITPHACIEKFNLICNLIYKENDQKSPNYATIKHLLNALFEMIEEERKSNISNKATTLHSRNKTFVTFLNILEENYKRAVGVEFYANKLFMSTRNLNLICQHILHKSVSEIIETRKLTEAKFLLCNSTSSISEIGFELGYKEKAYFTAVFKKKIGITPGQFRKEFQIHISEN